MKQYISFSFKVVPHLQGNLQFHTPKVSTFQHDEDMHRQPRFSVIYELVGYLSRINAQQNRALTSVVLILRKK